MTKTALKIAIADDQDFTCALTGAPIDPYATPELLDTDRVIERFRGGTYDPANTRIVTPRAHMERHGNLRHRPDWMDHLKSTMDSRRQTMKTLMKINNQLLAYQRLTDEPNPEDVDFLTETMQPIKARLDKIDRHVAKHMKASDHPLVIAALGVPSVGPITMAGLTVYVDLEKAGSASALWRYTGLHASSGERYQKGEAGGGNKTLRTMVWNMANSMTKNRKCPYREIYDRIKARLEVSEKIVKTRKNTGQLVELPWKDAMKSHRHGAALRAVMKHFLADYWFVGREIAGLDTRPLYVEEVLGHTSIIRPRARGWVW
jgi:hypothetical protein